MDVPVGREDLAILQLHKWGPSQTQINLSEFRKAFISPTRNIILLLSYQCEALLLPLVIGESHSSGPESGNYLVGMVESLVFMIKLLGIAKNQEACLPRDGKTEGRGKGLLPFYEDKGIQLELKANKE